MDARRGFIISVFAVCALSLAACSESAPTETASAPVVPATRVAHTPDFPSYTDTSGEVAEGARLFSYQRCAECHSDAGVILGAGNGNIDVIATAIRDGREGMPRYGGKLTDAQIWQLAAFVKALDTSPDTTTVRDGMDLTVSN